MENAVDALKIAAAILIFIIAIASSFSLFGIAKQTADSIITMRDKQAYLESAELDGGILYTSSSEIQKGEKETTLGVTTKGDRIVGIEDVISTVSRYSKEKYGVTIIDKAHKKVLARYDSNTEQIISQWNSIDTGKLTANGGYIDQLNKNTSTKGYGLDDVTLFEGDTLKSLYEITVNISHNDILQRTYSNVELLWGNPEEIQERIACDFKGGTFEKVSEREENISGTKFKITTTKTYTGKNLIANYLKDADKIVEVINEIDNSTYLKDTKDDGTKVETNLLQEYTMPTIEIVYIIL